MKNKSVESGINNLSVIITKRNNGERELLQKQGQSQSQTTMAGDNLITCNTQLAKSFNILKNPFDKDVSGNYYQKILTSNYKNNTTDSNDGTGISNDCAIDSASIQQSHKSINIHENNFFYDVINSNVDSSKNQSKDKRDLIPGTLNVKTCKHINQCTCNQAPVPLTEALQNISLAYNPITKQLHFSSSPGSSPKHHENNRGEDESVDIKQFHYFANDVLNKDPERIISKYAEDCNSLHSFEDVFENLNSNGFSDGTHSSVSEHSDIAESLVLESVTHDVSKHTEEDLCLGSVDSKKAGFSGFLSRAVSTIVGDSTQTKGWKFWPGRSTPEQKYSHVVASSTALIQHIRPPTLPAKDSAEESRHRAEYQRMLLEARQKEQRELEIKKTQQQSRAKREEAQAHRVKQWQEILPKFSQLRSLPHTRALWWHGLPPCTRGRVWILAIGNSLNVTHDDYLSCVQKARTKIALKNGLPIDSSFPVDSDRLYELFAIDGKSMKSASIKIISENSLKPNESRSTSTKLFKEVKSQNNMKHTTSKNNLVDQSSNASNNVSLAYLNLKQSEILTVNNSGASSSDGNGDEDACLEVIQLDISRTFPSLGVFQHGGPYYPILHALLAAYVTYKPEVGYVQGMSFLAAILILNMEPEDAFICFCNILEKPLHRAAFSLDQREMRAYFRAYEDLLRNNLPILHSHFSELGLSSDLYCVDWLYAAFSRAMPLDIACRVWDLFVRDGEAFLFRTAVGVLHLYQSELLEMDFIAAAQFLTRLPDTLSPDKLFRSIRQVNMTINKSSFVQLVETYKGHV